LPYSINTEYYFEEKKMICGNYKELVIPEKLKSPNWEKALAWLRTDSWKNIPEGKTEIDGTKVYVLRSNRMSKLRSECKYESHKLYADIQMVIKGGEIQLVCLRDGLNVVVPYSEEKDVDVLDGEAKFVNETVLSSPLAVVYLPWDIHMPNIALDDKPSNVDKIVMKVAL